MKKLIKLLERAAHVLHTLLRFDQQHHACFYLPLRRYRREWTNKKDSKSYQTLPTIIPEGCLYRVTETQVRFCSDNYFLTYGWGRDRRRYWVFDMPDKLLYRDDLGEPGKLNLTICHLAA